MAPFPISQKTEKLQENGFELKYPSDWKITSEKITSEYHQKTTVYDFLHPKNKLCHLAVKVLNFFEASAVVIPKDEVIATEIRVHKEMFARTGYQNFTFQSVQIKFANQFATQIKFRGRKGDIQRTTFTIIVPSQGRFYIVDYDWFDAWGVHVLDQLKSIAESFRLLG